MLWNVTLYFLTEVYIFFALSPWITQHFPYSTHQDLLNWRQKWSTVHLFYSFCACIISFLFLVSSFFLSLLLFILFSWQKWDQNGAIEWKKY